MDCRDGKGGTGGLAELALSAGDAVEAEVGC